MWIKLSNKCTPFVLFFSVNIDDEYIYFKNMLNIHIQHKPMQKSFMYLLYVLPSARF